MKGWKTNECVRPNPIIKSSTEFKRNYLFQNDYLSIELFNLVLSSAFYLFHKNYPSISIAKWNSINYSKLNLSVIARGQHRHKPNSKYTWKTWKSSRIPPLRALRDACEPSTLISCAEHVCNTIYLHSSNCERWGLRCHI